MKGDIIIRLKLLVMALSALVTLNTLVTTEPFAFTPEKVSTELSLGTVKPKNGFICLKKKGAKPAGLEIQ